MTATTSIERNRLMDPNATIDRNTYGAIETNGLVDGNAYHAQFHNADTVDWTAPGLYVTRLRLLTDPGFPMFDVSYCHGTLNGRPVRVRLPFGQLPKRGMRRFIVEQAKAAGIYARGLGILDNISTLS